MASWRRGPGSQDSMDGIQREMQGAKAWRKIDGLENVGLPTLQARLPRKRHSYTNGKVFCSGRAQSHHVLVQRKMLLFSWAQAGLCQRTRLSEQGTGWAPPNSPNLPSNTERQGGTEGRIPLLG